jgi:hypothetical protein
MEVNMTRDKRIAAYAMQIRERTAELAVQGLEQQVFDLEITIEELEDQLYDLMVKAKRRAA